jgi:hypothetical protein
MCGLLVKFKFYRPSSLSIFLSQSFRVWQIDGNRFTVSINYESEFIKLGLQATTDDNRQQRCRIWIPDRSKLTMIGRTLIAITVTVTEHRNSGTYSNGLTVCVKSAESDTFFLKNNMPKLKSLSFPFPLREKTYNFRIRLDDAQVPRATKSLYAKSFLVQSLFQWSVDKMSSKKAKGRLAARRFIHYESA